MSCKMLSVHVAKYVLETWHRDATRNTVGSWVTLRVRTLLPSPTVLTDRTCIQWASADGLGRPSSPHASPSKWATRIVRANMLLCTAQYKEEELPDPQTVARVIGIPIWRGYSLLQASNPHGTVKQPYLVMYLVFRWCLNMSISSLSF